MRRKLQILLILAIALPTWAGAARMTRRTAPRPVGGKWRDVADMTGRHVRVPAKPSHVLSLCTSATDTIVALGAGDRLVAIDEFSRVVPGSQRADVIGRGSAVSREMIAALGVDLALVWWYQDDAAGMLEDLGVPVVRIRAGRAADLPDMIRLVGDCIGCRVEAEKSVAGVKAFLAKPQAAAAGARVFLEMYGPLKTAGRDTYINDLLELAGMRNIAAEATGSVQLSAERLVEADPDVILCFGDVADAAALAARPGMAQLRAVREGRVRAVNRYWFVAGPHITESVEKLRHAVP